MVIAQYILVFFFFNLLYFGLHWVFFAAHGLPLVEASEGYLLVVMHRLLIAAASLALAQ